MPFKLVTVLREQGPTKNSELVGCQVIGYQKGAHADTEFFSDIVDCIKWATGNAHYFDKFAIFNEKWEYKVVGQVEEINGKKAISWGDVSI